MIAKKILLCLTVFLTLNIGMVAKASQYTVQAGNNLCKISQEVYGVQTMWDEIYQVNKDTIKNPNVIYVGQVLVMPDTYYSDVTPEDVAGIEEANALEK